MATHDETMYSASTSVSKEVPGKQYESDDEFDLLDLPEVPRQPLQSSADREVGKNPEGNEIASNKPKMESGEVLLEKSVTECKPPAQKEGEKFLPFIVPPPKSSSMSYSLGQSNPPPSISETQSKTSIDLQDVLAAESAESAAAAAARSAASLAQLRINELSKTKNDEVPVSPGENPFHADTQEADCLEKPHSGHETPFCNSASPHYINQMKHQVLNHPHDDASTGFDSPPSNNHILGQGQEYHQPQRLPSIDDETYFSYPNLFASQGSRAQSFNSRSPDEK